MKKMLLCVSMIVQKPIENYYFLIFVNSFSKTFNEEAFYGKIISTKKEWSALIILD